MIDDVTTPPKFMKDDVTTPPKFWKFDILVKDEKFFHCATTQHCI